MKNLVIIPTYNEIENIELILREVLKLHDVDVLVVDDSSPDKTGDKVKELQQEYHSRLFLLERKQKNGLGKAYVAGFTWGLDHGYDAIFEMDADFSHNPKDVPRLIQVIQNNEADMVVGSRYSHGVNVVNWPMGRVLLSYIASMYVKFITGLPIADSTAGFVGYSKEVLQALDLNKIKFKGYGFQIEMKYKIWKKNFRIKEIPIIFTDRSRGESKISSNIIWEAVFGVIHLRIKSIFGRL